MYRVVSDCAERTTKIITTSTKLLLAAKIRHIFVIAGIEVFVLYRYIIQRILKGRIVSG